MSQVARPWGVQCAGSEEKPIFVLNVFFASMGDYSIKPHRAEVILTHHIG
jgi:hypothetical protein